MVKNQISKPTKHKTTKRWKDLSKSQKIVSYVTCGFIVLLIVASILAAKGSRPMPQIIINGATTKGNEIIDTAFTSPYTLIVDDGSLGSGGVNMTINGKSIPSKPTSKSIHTYSIDITSASQQYTLVASNANATVKKTLVINYSGILTTPATKASPTAFTKPTQAPTISVDGCDR